MMHFLTKQKFITNCSLLPYYWICIQCDALRKEMNEIPPRHQPPIFLQSLSHYVALKYVFTEVCRSLLLKLCHTSDESFYMIHWVTIMTDSCVKLDHKASGILKPF